MTSPDGRDVITVPVDLGIAELVPDRRSPNAWALFVDGVAQSYVDLDDPAYLEFAYARRAAAAIDAVRRPRVPIDVLHLGGGGLSLPRYIAATRPGSRQRVIERDTALYRLVQERLPLPADVDVTVEIASARVAMASAARNAYDLVILDAFEAARMPDSVATMEFAALVRPALRADGLYVVNVTDMPTLALTKRLAATLRTVFGDVSVLADPGMLRGRRFGNCLLVASPRADGLPTAELIRSRAGDAGPVGILRNGALDTFISGARPLRDATVGDNPIGIRTAPRRAAEPDEDTD
jgi:DNA-binding NarL/FixJ family response regulator